jgi:hypothetical protein
MKISAFLITFISFAAHAHFEIGTYKGLSPAGTECSVTFESVSFTTAFKNPLSERVTVRSMDKTFVLQHTSKIDEEVGAVGFNEESLETTIPVLGGAEFFKVAMPEKEGKEGPDSFVYLTHDWKKNKMTKTLCENLVFQNE